MAEDNPENPPAELRGFAEAMMAEGEERKQRLDKVVADLQAEMEAASEQLRALVLIQPPTGLLGFLWSQFFLGVMQQHQEGEADVGPDRDLIRKFQFVLEYVHAVWSAHKSAFPEGQVDEAKATELFDVCAKLERTAMWYAMVSVRVGTFTEFGPATPEVEFRAKSAWILIRGHRYQVLEREFFEFALAPHEEALKEAYGVGVAEIAAGMQTIADTIRAGYSNAMIKLKERFEQSKGKIDAEGLTLTEAIDAARAEDGDFEGDVGSALKDMFFGGICNVSKHTKLPEPLLDDMAYRPGAEERFFADGPFKGTPLRTLPARVRPLIKLPDGFYATDGQFVRDSAYRAIQRGLIARKPDYKESWNKNQKVMTETAFPRSLATQLKGAQLYEEVYFKDAQTGDWVETDLVGLIDDILFVIEAKAGVMAMQSPATNFESHIRTIRELVVKAYRQCARFLEYLAAGADQPIYRLKGGKYEEVAKINLNTFRLVLPIGLTVEAFTPFSSMCKSIPEIAPILGKHPFVSMSVDDLLVLARFLPTGGELFHYLSVRQAVAGIPQAEMFDEMDHLGAYISRNRFDQDMRQQLEKADRVAWDSFSDRIDRHFEQVDWAEAPVPSQAYPEQLGALLDRLDRDRPKRWLRIDAQVRDFGTADREHIEGMLSALTGSLRQFPIRRMVLGNDNPVQVCLSTQIGQPTIPEMKRHAEVACLATGKPSIQVLRVQCNESGAFLVAASWEVAAPSPLRSDYATLKAEAEQMLARSKSKGKPRRK